jgi:hypothetical protein
MVGKGQDSDQRARREASSVRRVVSAFAGTRSTQSCSSRQTGKPSLRYIGLLIEGAAQHGLPPDYLDYLESFDLATDERPPQHRLPR